MRSFQQLCPVPGSLPLGPAALGEGAGRTRLPPPGAGCGSCCLSVCLNSTVLGSEATAKLHHLIHSGRLPCGPGLSEDGRPAAPSQEWWGSQPQTDTDPCTLHHRLLPNLPRTHRVYALGTRTGHPFSQHFTHSYFAARRCCWSNAKLKVSRVPPGHRVPSVSSPVCVSLV